MNEVLGHYKILERIGAGRLGEVYRARDTRLGRTVALKIVSPALAGDPIRRARLVADARRAATLSHPNIAALYEIGEDQGQLFLVFEYAPGETLARMIGGRALNPRRAVDLAAQIADALADAHAAGIVHGALVPEQVIVTPKGNAKLLDFGLAVWSVGGVGGEAGAVGRSDDRTPAGSTAYMSPEQALEERTDHRTDIFSLGVILFEMLVGRVPFSGPTASALTLQVVQARAPAPSMLNRAVPHELDAIVRKALAKSLDERYEAAATMAAELRATQAALEVRIESAAAHASVPVVGSPRRRIGPWIAIGVLAAAIAAGGWWGRSFIQRSWRSLGRPPRPLVVALPFELASPDPARTYFADGFTEDLVARLGQTAGLQVLGRSALRQFRGRDPAVIAKAVGASVVLTGSVALQGDRVTIVAGLLDPQDGITFWSGRYTRDLRNILALETEIGEQIAEALKLELRPTAASARAASRQVDAAAYLLYLQGRQAAAERRLPDAIKAFEAAASTDDGFVEAFAALAEALRLDAEGGLPADGGRADRMRAAAERAYQLDPDVPQADVAMGLASASLAQALGYLRHAIELDPSYAEAFRQVGDQIQDFDPERAIAFYQQALGLDPRFDVVRGALARAWLALDRPDDARSAIAAVPLEAGGGGGRAAVTLAIDLEQGRYDGVVAAAQRPPSLSEAFWLEFPVALRTAGRRDEAFEAATRLAAASGHPCEARALLAGLTLERGAQAAARQLAAPILGAASEETASPSLVRCAVLASAGIGDERGTAALLDRIAARETWLRSWAAGIGASTGRVSLRGRVYPWKGLVDKPSLVASRRRLEDAYGHEREAAGRALTGVLATAR